MAINLGFEPSTKEKGFIFISYAHKDANRVAAYAKGLHDAGYDVWYDLGIYPFENFKSVIIRQIQNCCCFIAFISPNYANSEHCLTETSEAMAAGISRLPIFIEQMGTLPGQLIYDIRNTQFFNAYECSVDFAVNSILERVKKIISGEIKEWSEWSTVERGNEATNPDSLRLADAAALIEQGNLLAAQRIYKEIVDAHPSNAEAYMGLIRTECSYQKERTNYNVSATNNEINEIERYWSKITSSRKRQYKREYNSILETYAQNAINYADKLHKSTSCATKHRNGAELITTLKILGRLEYLSESTRTRINNEMVRMQQLVDQSRAGYDEFQKNMDAENRKSRAFSVVFFIVFMIPGLIAAIHAGMSDNGNQLTTVFVVNAVMAFVMSLLWKIKTGHLPDLVDADDSSFFGTVWGLIKLVFMSLLYSLVILFVVGIVLAVSCLVS